jgi:hypothetical protein
MIESQIPLQIQLPTFHYQPLYKQQVAYKSAVPVENDEIRGNYNSSVTYSGSDACDKAGISALGINGPSTIYKNQTFE